VLLSHDVLIHNDSLGARDLRAEPMGAMTPQDRS
jgi:hypothetical protein